MVISACDPSAHAEIVAIRQACKLVGNYRLNKEYSLYVTLEPCIMCYTAILQSRIGNVYFGSYNHNTRRIMDFDSALKNNLFNHNLNIVGPIANNLTDSILNDFFVNKRNL